MDLDSLKKVVNALQRSLSAADNDMPSLNENLQETIRAGVTQNFKVAYEQSRKFIQRWIQENRSPSDADIPRTRRELFRMAARYGLISDPLPWFDFGDARNLTSHTYDQAQAASVFETAKEFLPYATELLLPFRLKRACPCVRTHFNYPNIRVHQQFSEDIKKTRSRINIFLYGITARSEYKIY